MEGKQEEAHVPSYIPMAGHSTHRRSQLCARERRRDRRNQPAVSVAMTCVVA